MRDKSAVQECVAVWEEPGWERKAAIHVPQVFARASAELSVRAAPSACPLFSVDRCDRSA
jgi:hypothetical protein